MNYLKDKQEYIDRYNLMTIEDCIKWYRKLKGSFLKHIKKLRKLILKPQFVGMVVSKLNYDNK